jgi:hypothetical protein
MELLKILAMILLISIIATAICISCMHKVFEKLIDLMLNIYFWTFVPRIKFIDQKIIDTSQEDDIYYASVSFNPSEFTQPECFIPMKIPIVRNYIHLDNGLEEIFDSILFEKIKNELLLQKETNKSVYRRIEKRIYGWGTINKPDLLIA